MTLYNADCLDIMRKMPDKSVDLVITDPPYGIRENNEHNLSRGTSSPKWKRGKPTDYGHFDWDNEQPSAEYFDEIFRISKNQVIFGGNHFGLPATSCIIVWDKENSGDFADAELAWTSFGFELDPEWHKIAEKRIFAALEQRNLFDGVET